MSTVKDSLIFETLFFKKQRAKIRQEITKKDTWPYPRKTKVFLWIPGAWSSPIHQDWLPHRNIIALRSPCEKETWLKHPPAVFLCDNSRSGTWRFRIDCSPFFHSVHGERWRKRWTEELWLTWLVALRCSQSSEHIPEPDLFPDFFTINHSENQEH